MKPRPAYKRWIVSLRLFSLPFIILPYILGISVAIFHDGQLAGTGLLVFGFVPLMLCHLAGNLQSDVKDYRNGIDKEPHVLSGGVIRGWVSPGRALRVAVVLYLCAIIIGIIGAVQLGPMVILFTIIGPGLGILYSAGNKKAVKYGLAGEWFVFAVYGIIVPCYGYYLNSGAITLEPMLFFVPAAFLMGAVKHANNWVATLDPENLEDRTLASRGGVVFSRYYYYALVMLPYLLTLAFYLWEESLGILLPGSFLIIYFSLPALILIIYIGSRNQQFLAGNRLHAIDSSTAMLFSLFNLLLCISFSLG